ncbi:MAG: hypothetical protein QOH57_4557 [Mycobacterium sp.]|nr:hypothetical protein [Mycobacterium sp.]
MAKNDARFTEGAAPEALPTAGLILLMASVIGFALFLAGIGTGSVTLAVAAGTLALVSFTGSLGLLVADTKRFADGGPYSNEPTASASSA